MAVGLSAWSLEPSKPDTESDMESVSLSQSSGCDSDGFGVEEGAGGYLISYSGGKVASNSKSLRSDNLGPVNSDAQDVEYGTSGWSGSMLS